MKNFNPIGEAAKQLPENFKVTHAAVPWSQMAGMRNRIVHAYAGVDLEIVREVVTQSLPALNEQIAGLS